MVTVLEDRHLIYATDGEEVWFLPLPDDPDGFADPEDDTDPLAQSEQMF